MFLNQLRRADGLTRGLHVALIAAFLLPTNPGLLLAQGDPGLPTPAGKTPAKPSLDLEVLGAASINPETGTPEFSTTDMRLGEGPLAVEFRRTWRELEGARTGLGQGWALTVDERLEGTDSKTVCWVDGRGERRWFALDGDVWTATRGRPATLRRLLDKSSEVSGYELTGLGDRLTRRFDKAGDLVSLSDANGRALTMTRAAGLCGAIEGPAGRIAIRRDDENRIIGLTGPDSLRVSYSYDKSGRVSRVDNADNTFWTYQYDSFGRLTVVGAEHLKFSYDSVGRVSRIHGKNVRDRKISYIQSADPIRSWITLIDSGAEEPALWARNYDGTRIETISVDGRRTVVQLDGRERPAYVIDAEGKTQEFGYDERGRLAVSVSPGQLITELTYKGDAEQPSTIKRGEKTWSYRYDAAGNVTAVTVPGGMTTKFTYDERGRRSTATSPRGLKTRYTWNDKDQLVREESEDGRVTALERDERGLVTAITRPDGKTYKLEHDAMGRLTKLVDGAGRKVTFAWNRFGKLQTRSDELGGVYTYRYTRFGELTSVEDALGQVLSYKYDEAGRVNAVIDAEGNKTSYTHTREKLIVTNPNGGQNSYEFDEARRIRTETLPNGKKLKYDYNNLGLLKSLTDPTGEVAKFAYDNLGRLIRMGDKDSSYRLAWTANDRPASLTDEALGLQIDYEYDVFGSRSAMVLPFGKISYSYDKRGRLETLTDTDGKLIRFEYTKGDRRAAIHYPNGVKTRFGYDDQDRLESIVTKDKAGKVVSSRIYKYAATGRMASMTDESGTVERYDYDLRGRLVGIRRGENAERFKYDAVGNRTAQVVGDRTVDYEIKSGNRLVRRGIERFEYDAAGNMIRRFAADGVTRYRYDHHNRLVAVALPSGKTVKYGYAPNGTRVWRELDGKKTYYLYDFADVVAEYDASRKLVRTYTHGDKTDDVLAAHAAADKGQADYYHFDMVRSVVAMTNSAGEVSGRYDYSAFGELRGRSGDATAWNPYTYTSRRRDQATGLQYSRARTYAPDLGRFTSLDPMGFFDGPNRYAYVKNDPIQFNDPYGLWSWRGLVDSVGSGISSAASAVGSAAKATWETTKTVVRHTGNFAKGFGKGVVGAVEGVAHLVTHPVQSAKAIYGAVVNYEQTWEAMKEMGQNYVDAWHNDPDKFWEMTGQITAELALVAAGGGAVAAVSKAGTVARVASGAARLSRAAGVTRAVGSAGARLARAGSRVASAGRAVGARAARVGANAARRFPRTASALNRAGTTARRAGVAVNRVLSNTARRARVIDRANRMRRARIAAMGGNFVTRTARGVRNLPGRLAATARLAVRQPGAFLAYGTYAMTRGTLRAVTGMALSTARMGAIATVPAAIVLRTEIDDAINRWESREAALGDVLESSNALLDGVENASAEELVARLERAGSDYEMYRNYLLKPVRDENAKVARELEALNDEAANADLSDTAALDRFSNQIDALIRRKENMIAETYRNGQDVEHGHTNPSPNRLISYDDEIALLNAARERVTDDERRGIIDRRIEVLEANKMVEEQLFMEGRFKELLEYVAADTLPEPEGEGALPGDQLPGAGAELGLNDAGEPITPQAGGGFEPVGETGGSALPGTDAESRGIAGELEAAFELDQDAWENEEWEPDPDSDWDDWANEPYDPND